jgi:carboxyl-terminal processing protease
LHPLEFTFSLILRWPFAVPVVVDLRFGHSFHGRTMVLINEQSHSAAEMVASFAKEDHLATLVVTKTAGEVLGGANFKLPGGYVLGMPVAGWYTWNGECIEGKGVEADLPIENSPESLAAGVDNQLQAALEVVNTL